MTDSTKTLPLGLFGPRHSVSKSTKRHRASPRTSADAKRCMSYHTLGQLQRAVRAKRLKGGIYVQRPKNKYELAVQLNNAGYKCAVRPPSPYRGKRRSSKRSSRKPKLAPRPATL